MAKYFTDRVVQYPGRVVMNPVSGEANTYDMSRAEGTVTEEGTPFNAETFNGIANQILQDAINAAVAQAKTETLAELGDYVIEEGTSGDWKYRKWNSGKVEMWGSYTFSAKQGTSWAAGLYYTDETISFPAGIFTAAPRKYVTPNSSQWAAYSAWGISKSSLIVRFTKPNSNNAAGGAYIYLVQD